MNEEIIIIQDEKVQEIDTIKESVKYIEPITQEKTVTPTKQQQEVVADSGFTSLSKVVVNSIPNNYQEVKGEVLLKTNGVHNVAPYETAKVEFEVNLEERTESAVASGDLIVVPSSGYDGMSKVIINKVTASIDPQIKEENIRKGVDILGVVGKFEGSPILQEKEITPTKSIQNVIADDGYNGLSKVIVEPIPSDYIKPSGIMTVTENGTYDVKSYASVVANVHENTGEEQNYFIDITSGSSGRPGILSAIFDVPSTIAITTGSNAFQYCINLPKVPALDYSNITSCGSMFSGCTSLVDTSNFINLINGTSLMNAFTNCTSLVNAKLDNLNCTKLVELNGLFNGCSNLVSVDLSNFVTSVGTKAPSMFYNCSKLTTVILNNCNITRFYYGYRMFYGCKKLVNIDLSCFDSSSRTDLDVCEMFYNCSALQKIDIRKLNVSKITSSTNYNNMLYNVPKSCLIIVMDDACKTWFGSNFSAWTNVKTVAELG